MATYYRETAKESNCSMAAQWLLNTKNFRCWVPPDVRDVPMAYGYGNTERHLF